MWRKGLQTFNAKVPLLLLWAGWRAARGRVIQWYSQRPKSLRNFCSVQTIYKCGRGPLNTAWRAAGWRPLIQIYHRIVLQARRAQSLVTSHQAICRIIRDLNPVGSRVTKLFQKVCKIHRFHTASCSTGTVLCLEVNKAGVVHAVNHSKETSFQFKVRGHTSTPHMLLRVIE